MDRIVFGVRVILVVIVAAVLVVIFGLSSIKAQGFQLDALLCKESEDYGSESCVRMEEVYGVASKNYHTDTNYRNRIDFMVIASAERSTENAKKVANFTLEYTNKRVKLSADVFKRIDAVSRK